MSNSTERILSIFLKFGADQQSIERSIAAFKQIQGELNDLEKEAEELQRDIAAALEHGQDASGLTGELKTVEAAMGNLRRKAETELNAGLNSSFDSVARSAQRTGASIGQSFNLRDIGEKMNFVGQAMSNAGQGMTGSLMGVVNAYISASGQYSQEAQRWNAAQQEMQAAYQRIGKVALDKLTPYIERAADLLDKLADFIEKNPDLISAIAGTGAALTLGGQLVSGLAQLAMIAGSLQGLGKLVGSGGALEGAGAAVEAAGTAALPVAVTAGALGVGAVAGQWVGNAFNRATGQQEQSAGDIARTAQELSAMLSPLNALSAGLRAAGFEDQANAVWTFVKSMNGLGEAAQDAGAKVGSGTNALASQNLEAFIELEKQKAQAASQYADQVREAEAEAEKRRAEIIKNFAEQAARAEESYQRERAAAERSQAASNLQAAKSHTQQLGKLASDFALSESRAEQDYYRSRAEAAKNHDLEVQRMEADHQREMLKLQQEHNGRVSDLVAARDALGLVKEQRDYEKQRAEAEGDYSREAQRKNQDYARQMADLEASFAQARARRREDYERQVSENRQQYSEQQAQRARDFAQQQAEREQQHAAQMEQLKKDEAEQLQQLDRSTAEQLNKLKSAYDKQTQMMQTAFIDRLNSLSKSIMGDTAAFENYMRQKSSDFEAFLKSKGYSGSGTTPARRASGGSVSAGLTYLVGERGPELFSAPGNGSILPAGLTSALLNPRGNYARDSRSLTLKIESQALTLTEILGEVDRRFARYDQALASAFA